MGAQFAVSVAVPASVPASEEPDQVILKFETGTPVEAFTVAAEPAALVYPQLLKLLPASV